MLIEPTPGRLSCHRQTEYDQEHFRIRLERSYEALGGAGLRVRSCGRKCRRDRNIGVTGAIFIVLARHI
jgi:hypothetical protein